VKKIYNYLKNKYEDTLNKPLLSKLILIGVGISATLWFLIRVIPKPTRATYPCMQAAAPLMSTFVIYLLSLWGGLAAFHKARKLIAGQKAGLSILFIFLFTVSGIVFISNNIDSSLANSYDFEKKTVLFTLSPNKPLGTAKGIFPGRVAWAYKPNTATWDMENGRWFEDRWNNQENCDWMVKQTILSLTGKKKEQEAWKALFTSFNKNRNKGNASYKEGEKIAIKINQNNTYSHSDSEELNASPHLTLSLLRSLIYKAGVKQGDVTVFDASRYVTDFIYNKCKSEFPEVKFVDNSGEDGRIKSQYIENAIPYSVDNGKLAKGLASCVVESDYNINMAILKGHVGQGVTLCGKNWYGVTSIHSDWRKNAHDNFNQNRDGSPRYMTFTDYMGHKNLGGKTLIYFIDGLYGSQNVAGKPSGKWQMQPFNGDWPNSLFASQDPVAIDAVGLDFLTTEFPGMADTDYSDSYLIEAAQADNPPSGAFYDPERDGVKCPSLGVVEHWNNPVDKKYSRNLGKDTGIELVLCK